MSSFCNAPPRYLLPTFAPLHDSRKSEFITRASSPRRRSVVLRAPPTVKSRSETFSKSFCSAAFPPFWYLSNRYTILVRCAEKLFKKNTFLCTGRRDRSFFQRWNLKIFHRWGKTKENGKTRSIQSNPLFFFFQLRHYTRGMSRESTYFHSLELGRFSFFAAHFYEPLSECEHFSEKYAMRIFFY